MGERKYVQLMFLAGGMLLAYLMVQTTDWIWGYFEKPPRMYVNIVGILLGGMGTWLLWRHRQTQQSASETVAELRKVTWPTRKETSQATVVVIITVIIASIFLQIFDAFWSRVTGYILG